MTKLHTLTHENMSSSKQIVPKSKEQSKEFRAKSNALVTTTTQTAMLQTGVDKVSKNQMKSAKGVVHNAKDLARKMASQLLPDGTRKYTDQVILDFISSLAQAGALVGISEFMIKRIQSPVAPVAASQLVLEMAQQ